MPRSITVITITRGRPALLARAIASVRAQTYAGPITHTILVDDCPATASMLTEMTEASPGAFEWQFVPRAKQDRDGPDRLARLRNRAVRNAASDSVAFLDDDNEFEPNHLGSLVACAFDTGGQAVHSWRRLYQADGTPYVEPRMPWKRDRAEGNRLYQELCAKGVFVPGSNVVRDRADPKGYPNPAQMVDMGEWLFDRALLLEFPFCEHYSHQDWLDVIPEDNKLLQSLVDHNVRIASTRQPTLRYYLGGYSNAFSPERTTSNVWAETPQDEPAAADDGKKHAGAQPTYDFDAQSFISIIPSNERITAA